MNAKLKISDEVIQFIKKWEGFSPVVYKCSAGKSTIGYGHVLRNKDISEISKPDAEALLALDLKIARQVIDTLITVELSQGQYNALISLVFNIGGSNLAKSNGLYMLNKGEYSLAAFEFFDENIGFTRVGKNKIKGLINRRLDEWELWIGKKDV